MRSLLQQRRVGVAPLKQVSEQILTLLRGAPSLSQHKRPVQLKGQDGSRCGQTRNGPKVTAAGRSATSSLPLSERLKQRLINSFATHPVIESIIDFDWARFMERNLFRPFRRLRTPQPVQRSHRFKVDPAADEFREYRFIRGEYIEWARIPSKFLPRYYNLSYETMGANAIILACVGNVLICVFAFTFWLVRDPLLALYYKLDSYRVKFERTAEMELIREEERNLDEVFGTRSKPIPDFITAPPNEVHETWQKFSQLRNKIEEQMARRPRHGTNSGSET